MDEKTAGKSWPPNLPCDPIGMELEKALVLIENSKKESLKLGFATTLAVCDSGGNMVAVQRMDNAALFTLEVAQNKAKTAVFGKMPTLLWKGEFSGPSPELVPLFFHSDWITFIGGFPVIIDGKLIGGFGVSGATWEAGLIAKAGLKALGAELNGVEKCLEIYGPPKEKPKLRYSFPGW